LAEKQIQTKSPYKWLLNTMNPTSTAVNWKCILMEMQKVFNERVISGEQ
jgi:hypothetical protein